MPNITDNGEHASALPTEDLINRAHGLSIALYHLVEHLGAGNAVEAVGAISAELTEQFAVGVFSIRLHRYQFSATHVSL